MNETNWIQSRSSEQFAPAVESCEASDYLLSRMSGSRFQSFVFHFRFCLRGIGYVSVCVLKYNTSMIPQLNFRLP